GGGRDVAKAEIAGHGVAHRAAAAGTGDDVGDVDAVILEETLLQRDAVWRPGRVVLVLGNQEIGRIGRPNRCKTERGDEHDAPETHAVLLKMTFGAPRSVRGSRSATGPA